MVALVVDAVGSGGGGIASCNQRVIDDIHKMNTALWTSDYAGNLFLLSSAILFPLNSPRSSRLSIQNEPGARKKAALQEAILSPSKDNCTLSS